MNIVQKYTIKRRRRKQNWAVQKKDYNNVFILLNGWICLHGVLD